MIYIISDQIVPKLLLMPTTEVSKMSVGKVNTRFISDF